MDACRSLMTAYTAPQSGDLHTGSMRSVGVFIGRHCGTKSGTDCARSCV